MGERTWNVGDRVQVHADEVNRGPMRHTNRTGWIAETNPDDEYGWHAGVRFDGEPIDTPLSWFAGHELAPAPARPAVEVWEWKDAPPEWRELWFERYPEPPKYVVSGLDVVLYGPHLAVVSRPGFDAYAEQVLNELDVDGCYEFRLSNGDRLDVIVSEQRQETE